MIKNNAFFCAQPSRLSPRTPSLRQLFATLCLVLTLGIAQSALAVDGVGLYDTTTGTFRLVESDGTPLREFRITFTRGRGQLPITGNWDGARGIRRGGDTVGLYNPRSGKFKLRNSNFTGPADRVIRFGGRRRFGWTPLAGDWMGNGRDSIGLYNPRTSTFRLRKTLARRSRSLVFKFGDLGLDLIPITGDWNQDGIDTVGLYDSINGLFYLTNSTRDGPPDIFALAVREGGNDLVRDSYVNRPDDVFPVPRRDRLADIFPVSGLDGSADVFPISRREVPGSSVDFSDREEQAGIIVRFGEQGLGWKPIAGNWTVSFFDSVGLYDPFQNAFLLRFTNTSGPPNRVIRFIRGRGGRTQLPLAGDWRR